MCPKETVAAVTALAALITEKLTPEQSAFLAAVFVQLGDTIATIIAADNFCRHKKHPPETAGVLTSQIS